MHRTSLIQIRPYRILSIFVKESTDRICNGSSMNGFIKKDFPNIILAGFQKHQEENQYTVEVTLQQTQMIPMDFPVYKMPFDFEFVMPEKLGSENEIYPNSVIFEKMVDNEFEKFSFLLNFDPVRFNPDSDKFLCEKSIKVPISFPRDLVQSVWNLKKLKTSC